MPQSELTSAEFATRLLDLLDQASAVTTYKFALLLALVEDCQERAGDTETGSTTTRRLAERVVRLYWQQSVPFGGGNEAGVLSQLTRAQPSIVDHVAAARRAHPEAATSPHRFRMMRPEKYRELVDRVEWILIRYPIRLLQPAGSPGLQILYVVPWEREPSEGRVRRYQRGLVSGGGTADFDNVLQFRPGAERHLRDLAGIFRPLIQREWTRFVARCNGAVIEELEGFLFEPRREYLAPLGGPLRELQGGRCLYCDDALRARDVDVDHFLPWSRCRYDGLDNLVAAHRSCNNDKRHHLASAHHLLAWRRRLDDHVADLRTLARSAVLPCEPSRSIAIGRSLYRALPRSTLWQGKDVYEETMCDDERLQRALREWEGDAA